MTSGEVADMLGVKPQTIRNWVNNPHLNEFFSPSARDKERTRADFTQRDLLVLNTIHTLSRRGTAWTVIAEQLRADAFVTDLPNRAAVVESLPTTAEQVARIQATIMERDAALEQVRLKDADIRERDRRISELYEEIRRIENEKHSIEIEKAQLIAQLETELRLYREGRIKPPKP